MEQGGSTGRRAFTAKEQADSKVVLPTQGDASKPKIKASPFSLERDSIQTFIKRKNTVNWYYLDTQQNRIGPISDLEIQNLVSIGTLNKTSLVWNETLTEWTSVAQTPLATFCAAATLPIAPKVNVKSTTRTATPSAQAKLLNKASILIKSLWSKTRAAASLSQKQALQQKLKMVDLNQADYNIGCKAFENKIGYNEYGNLYSQIEVIKSRIETLKTKTSEPTVTLTEKAKAAAIGTAKAAEIGTQTINEKKALINLGRMLRENPGTYPYLTEEIGTANGLIEKASILDKEIQALSNKSFVFAKYSWLILTIFIVFGIGLAVYITKVAHVGSDNESGPYAYLSERAKHTTGESETQITQPASHAVDYEVVKINKNVSTSGNTNKYDGFVTIKTHSKNNVFIVYEISTYDPLVPELADNPSTLQAIIVYNNVTFEPNAKNEGFSFLPDGHKQSSTFDDSAVLHRGCYKLFNEIAPKFQEWCDHARKVGLSEEFNKDLTRNLTDSLLPRAEFWWKGGKATLNIRPYSSAESSEILPEWSVSELQYALSVFPSVAEILKKSKQDGNNTYSQEDERKRKLNEGFK